MWLVGPKCLVERIASTRRIRLVEDLLHLLFVDPEVFERIPEPFQLWRVRRLGVGRFGLRMNVYG